MSIRGLVLPLQQLSEQVWMWTPWPVRAVQMPAHFSVAVAAVCAMRSEEQVDSEVRVVGAPARPGDP